MKPPSETFWSIVFILELLIGTIALCIVTGGVS
jgi:hypothetical protein